MIILGAGASYADGAPLQGDLIGRLVSKQTTRAEKIRTGLADLFGADVPGDTEGYPTLEEILGVLDLALQRQESFRGYANQGGNSRVGSLREDIVLGIASELDLKLRPNAIHNRALVDRLAADERLLDTTFVSLNYDIVIDNALVERHDVADLDYGVDFVNFGDAPEQWHRPREERSVSLLKIHGSLNWLYCPACTALEITPKAKGGARLGDLATEPKRCNCGASVVPILLPPTFFKVLNNVHLHRVWNKTELALRAADRLIFCGYSFPDADLLFKYAIKRAEVGRNKPWEVCIVNGRKGSSLEKRKTIERYERFLSTPNVKNTGLTFEKFAANGLDG
ncbi:MAG: SIR2 family protein [Candidatus Thermoplasmatota archaeon]